MTIISIIIFITIFNITLRVHPKVQLGGEVVFMLSIWENLGL
jgi:hypothetical protein